MVYVVKKLIFFSLQELTVSYQSIYTIDGKNYFFVSN